MNPIQQSHIGYQSVTIGAGLTDEKRIQGQRLDFVDANGDFFVRIDNLQEVPGAKGFQFGMASGESFQSVTIRNPSATDAITVKYFYGTLDFVDARLNIIQPTIIQQVVFLEGPTQASLSGQSSIAAGGTIATAGIPIPTNGIRIKYISITNADPTAALVIEDLVGGFIDWVLPMSNKRVDGNVSVVIRNNTGQLIPCSVYTMWYISSP